MRDSVRLPTRRTTCVTKIADERYPSGVARGDGKRWFLMATLRVESFRISIFSWLSTRVSRARDCRRASRRVVREVSRRLALISSLPLVGPHGDCSSQRRNLSGKCGSCAATGVRCNGARASALRRAFHSAPFPNAPYAWWRGAQSFVPLMLPVKGRMPSSGLHPLDATTPSLRHHAL